MINHQKLYRELLNAGLPVAGVDPNTGEVEWVKGHTPTSAQISEAHTVLAAHNPAPTRLQMVNQLGFPTLLDAAMVLAVAGGQVPDWAKSTVASAAEELRKV